MIIFGEDTDEMPFTIDTTKIKAVDCYKDHHDTWVCRLWLDGENSFPIMDYYTFKLNGVTIKHEDTKESCKRIAEIFGEIMYLEREDPPVDMEKFAQIGKPKKRKTK